VDISSGTELRIGGGGLTVTQPLFSLTTDLPGDRGRLSVDGNFAITAGTDNLPLVSDTRDGADQGTWFRKKWTPVVAAFSHQGRVVWVADDGDGTLGLFSCAAAKDFVDSFHPDSEPCTQVYDLTDTVPVLAGGAIGAPTDEG
jgi:hypothetical protein